MAFYADNLRSVTYCLMDYSALLASSPSGIVFSLTSFPPEMRRPPHWSPMKYVEQFMFYLRDNLGGKNDDTLKFLRERAAALRKDSKADDKLGYRETTTYCPSTRAWTWSRRDADDQFDSPKRQAQRHQFGKPGETDRDLPQGKEKHPRSLRHFFATKCQQPA